MDKRIVNLTQHKATPEQIVQGVRDATDAEEVKELLTFADIPDAVEIEDIAGELAEIAWREMAVPEDAYESSDYPEYILPDGSAAMIGGAPYLMASLECELMARGIKPLYAFSKRESVEEMQSDGSIRKVTMFKHIGFVEVNGAYV